MSVPISQTELEGLLRSLVDGHGYARLSDVEAAARALAESRARTLDQPLPATAAAAEVELVTLDGARVRVGLRLVTYTCHALVPDLGVRREPA